MENSNLNLKKADIISAESHMLYMQDFRHKRNMRNLRKH